MARSDETYLESFIEQISTLPHEVRRNLDLMKDLDKSCSTLTEQMIKLQQDYINMIQDKMLELQVAPIQSNDDENDDNNEKMAPAKIGVKVIDNDGDSSAVVIPTTEELVNYVHDAQAYHEIQQIQQQVVQRSEEKVAIATQTYGLVDATCQRLESDLKELEALLQSTGGFQAPGAAKPDDLAAIQIAPGSPDWILAKVITYDSQTGMYKLSDEDVESNKIFNLPENQVVLLGGLNNLTRGDIVYAVYPDTTSFYQATISQPPRKVSGGGGNNSFVMVNFVDDSDEHGITHEKAVLLKHVMMPPYGAILL